MEHMTLEKPDTAAAAETGIAFSEKLGFSRFFLDFISGKSSALQFFPAQDAAETARRIDSVTYPRSELAKILRRQNKQFGSKPEAFARIDLLEDERALVVFAGQQAGLFGGPLLGFYKALWTVKAASDLSRLLDRPVIPIFWIAADDHDFDEINHAFVFDMIGEPQRLSYYESDQPGRPAYQRLLSNTDLCSEMTGTLRDALGKTDFSTEVAERLCRAYCQGTDFVTAFGKFMADTLPDIGLALFSPGDNDWKKLSSQMYHTILDKHGELKSRISAANEKLLEAGYHLQVAKEETACHMFMLIPEREPIHTTEHGFRVGDTAYTSAELKELINKQPERFSPDVFTRPLLSAHMFPTMVQAGGPSELAYFAQMSGLYELINRPAPIFMGRLSATLIEKRFEKLMTKHNIEFTDFAGDVEQVINEILGKSFPADLEKRFADVRRAFKESFDLLASEVTSFDKSLEANSGQVWGKINNALENFEKKAFASHKRKLADERAAIYRAANALFPRRALQERSISMIYYLSRYGYRIVDYLTAALDVDTTQHQLIYLSEMDRAGQ